MPSASAAGHVRGGALRTTGGGAWTSISTGLLPAAFSMAIDPTATSTLSAGTLMGQGGGIFETTDAGGMWVPINTGLPAPDGLAVTALALDAMAHDTLYAALENTGVFKTTDGGASWTAVGGLPSVQVVALAVDPVIPNTVFAGTHDQGVFVSIDGGATWASMTVSSTISSRRSRSSLGEGRRPG